MMGENSSDLPSMELSLETTVPTDLTISQSESDDASHAHTNRREKIHFIIQKKKLTHELQRLKIELSQKNTMIDNLKLQYITTFDELEEKLQESLHQKRLVTKTLENRIKMMEEEAKLKQEKYGSHLKGLLEKQRMLEEVNRNVKETVDEVKRSFDDLVISEEEHERLIYEEPKNLSIQQYISLKVYESLNELKLEKNKLGGQVQHLTTKLKSFENAIGQLKNEVSKYQLENQKIKGDRDIAIGKLNNAIRDVHRENFKIDNFDKLKLERDTLSEINMEMSKQLKQVQSNYRDLNEDRVELKSERDTLRQELALVSSNDEALKNRFDRLKLVHDEEKNQFSVLSNQLSNAKQVIRLLQTKYAQLQEINKDEEKKNMEDKLKNLQIKLSTKVKVIQEDYEQTLTSLKMDLMDEKLNQESFNLLQRQYTEKLEIERTQNLNFQVKLASKKNETDQLVKSIDKLKDNLMVAQRQNNELKAEVGNLNQRVDNTRIRPIIGDFGAKPVYHQGVVIDSYQTVLMSLQESVNRLTNEKMQMSMEKEELFNDMKKLLDNHEELQMIKNVLNGLTLRRNQAKKKA